MTDDSMADDSMTDAPEVRSWAWHLLQLSAWVLVVLLPVHLVLTWLVHDSGSFGVATYVDRWHTAPWRIFDWAFVALALLHGGIGLNSVLAPLAGSARSRRAVSVVVGAAFATLGVAVSLAILRFVI
jgi:succinate dehydrogenase hydrophobic anchor subunit